MTGVDAKMSGENFPYPATTLIKKYLNWFPSKTMEELIYSSMVKLNSNTVLFYEFIQLLWGALKKKG